MNSLFIYGPPASGKLTVAEELAKLTSYKLFHNHLTMDLARELYPEFGELRFQLADKLRLSVFEYAAEHDTHLIFTFVYSGVEGDDGFVARTVDVIQKAQGNVFFVELSAPYSILLERVSNESRKQFHKLKDPQILSTQLEAKLYSKSIPHPNILKVDTSLQKASETALKIKEHYKL